MRGTLAVNDRSFPQQVPLLVLAGGTLGPLAHNGPAGTATLTGTTANLSATSAEALVAAFATTALDRSPRSATCG